MDFWSLTTKLLNKPATQFLVRPTYWSSYFFINLYWARLHLNTQNLTLTSLQFRSFFISSLTDHWLHILYSFTYNSVYFRLWSHSNRCWLQILYSCTYSCVRIQICVRGIMYSCCYEFMYVCLLLYSFSVWCRLSSMLVFIFYLVCI